MICVQGRLLPVSYLIMLTPYLERVRMTLKWTQRIQMINLLILRTTQCRFTMWIMDNLKMEINYLLAILKKNMVHWLHFISLYHSDLHLCKFKTFWDFRHFISRASISKNEAIDQIVSDQFQKDIDKKHAEILIWASGIWFHCWCRYWLQNWNSKCWL